MPNDTLLQKISAKVKKQSEDIQLKPEKEQTVAKLRMSAAQFAEIEASPNQDTLIDAYLAQFESDLNKILPKGQLVFKDPVLESGGYMWEVRGTRK